MQLLKERPARKRVVEKAEPQPREYRKLISGGLAGFSGVAVLQLLGAGHIDSALKIALYAFAIAIPLLVKDLMDAHMEERHGITIGIESRLTPTVLGITAALTGVASIFWHYSSLMGALFFAVSVWCALAHGRYMDELFKEAESGDKR